MKISSFILLTLLFALPGMAQQEAPSASPSVPETQRGPARETNETSDQPIGDTTRPGAGADSEKSNPITVNLEIDVRSRYVYRGVVYSQGFVVQPNLALTRRNTTLSFFGNFNGTLRPGTFQSPRQLDEIDYTITQSFSLGKTNGSMGFSYYDYPTGLFPETGELSLNFSRPYRKATLFWNNNLVVWGSEGAYFGEVGASQEYELGNKAKASLIASLGFANGKSNEVNIGPRKSALNVFRLGASYTYQLNGRFYVRPRLSFTHILDRDLRNALDKPTILEQAVVLGYDF